MTYSMSIKCAKLCQAKRLLRNTHGICIQNNSQKFSDHKILEKAFFSLHNTERSKSIRFGEPLEYSVKDCECWSRCREKNEVHIGRYVHLWQDSVLLEPAEPVGHSLQLQISRCDRSTVSGVPLWGGDVTTT